MINFPPPPSPPSEGKNWEFIFKLFLQNFYVFDNKILWRRKRIVLIVFESVYAQQKIIRSRKQY